MRSQQFSPKEGKRERGGWVNGVRHARHCLYAKIPEQNKNKTNFLYRTIVLFF